LNLGEAVSLTVEKAEWIGIVSLAAQRAHICQSVSGERIAEPPISLAIDRAETWEDARGRYPSSAVTGL